MTRSSQTTPSLTWSGVTARRMARHALTQPATDLGPADVAGVLCGAHAQIASAAELSIGRRIGGATRADVRRALWQDRTLVKTFGPRGTVHLLSTADLRMWTGALSALPSSVPMHPAPVRFTPAQADQVITAIGDALADTELTVDELTEAVVDRTGPWAGERTMVAFQGMWPRWRQLTSTAAHRGILCFGPNRGRNVTYTNPRRWLPDFRPDDGDAALRLLVTRYLYAYGPATPHHFARWLGIPARRAAELFDELAGKLEHTVRATCRGGGRPRADAQAPPGARALPDHCPRPAPGQPPVASGPPLHARPELRALAQDGPVRPAIATRNEILPDAPEAGLGRELRCDQR